MKSKTGDPLPAGSVLPALDPGKGSGYNDYVWTQVKQVNE